MFRRVLPLAAVVVAAMTLLLLAGQPGEKAVGPSFKPDAATTGPEFTLVWGKLKSSSEVVLGDDSKSKYSVSLEGSVEAPKDVDAVAICKRFDLRSCQDDAGRDITPRTVSSTGGKGYNAFHNQVAQVEFARVELSRDATRIGKMVLDSEVVIARKREEVKLPAVVMEDYKDIGNGISVRIAQLKMSPSRELNVTFNYKRIDAGTNCPFFEQMVAMDPDGKDIGGGRWTEGDPFGKAGIFTAKFMLSGNQVHQSFRLIVVTESETRKVSFEVKDMFKR